MGIYFSQGLLDNLRLIEKSDSHLTIWYLSNKYTFFPKIWVFNIYALLTVVLLHASKLKAKMILHFDQSEKTELGKSKQIKMFNMVKNWVAVVLVVVNSFFDWKNV